MHRKPITLNNIIWRFILALAIALPASIAVQTREVEAGGGPLPFFGLIPAAIKRNRVYKTANGFIKEKAQYYDSLRDKAAEMLLERDLYTTELRTNQIAAYGKVVALIEQERDWMYDFAESEKKAARDEFMDVLQDEITGRMLATTPATAVLGALINGINKSQGVLGTAIDTIQGGGGGFLGEVAKVKRIAERIQIAGGVIGGPFGETIRKAGTDIVDLINKPTAEIESGLVQVQQELGDLGDLVNGLQEQGYQPVASQTTRDVVISLVTGEDANPTINQIVDMLIAKHESAADFRDRASDILAGNQAARCAARIEQIRRITFKLQMDPADEDTSDITDYPTCEQINIAAMVEEVADADTATAEEEESTSADAEDAPQPSQDSQTDSSPPGDTGSDTTETEPFVSSSEYIWVLTNTETNPTNEPTSFYGGGQTPGFFTEARFEGKSMVFGCSANNFTIHDVDVDHEYEYHNVTIGADFDSPPSRLDPGQEVELKAFASSSGTVNEGGAGVNLRFQYHVNNNGLEPTLGYFPWAANFDGTSNGTWSFTAPGASEGGEFTVTAGLWNVPPCHTIWTYQARVNENAQPPQDWENIAATDRRYTPEQCREKQQEVASKVSIARGADVADLELGIVGYVVAQMGSGRIDYCEGGGAESQKGIPIRIGDCLQTGDRGRMRIQMNDQDDKNNKGPSYLGMGTNSVMCFSSFAVHRDDGKPGLIDMVKGTLRVITDGWRRGWGFGVQAQVKTAVVIGSDVVLEYDPELDLLRSYVNEGSMEVSDTSTGESQLLTEGELLISQRDSLGTVENMSSRVWKDLIADNGLDLERNSGSPDGSSSLGRTALIIGGVCGGGLLLVLVFGGVILFRRKKSKGK